MKALVPLLFLAALGAVVLLPVDLEIAASLLSAGAVLAIAVADYSRARPLIPMRITVAVSRKERLGLAA